jgi:hypothetical protein
MLTQFKSLDFSWLVLSSLNPWSKSFRLTFSVSVFWPRDEYQYSNNNKFKLVHENIFLLIFELPTYTTRRREKMRLERDKDHRRTSISKQQHDLMASFLHLLFKQYHFSQFWQFSWSPHSEFQGSQRLWQHPFPQQLLQKQHVSHQASLSQPNNVKSCSERRGIQWWWRIGNHWCWDRR